MIVANKQGTMVPGPRKRVEDDIAVSEGSISGKEFAPIPALSHDTVLRISQRFASLNPYDFDGTILKVEDVNYEDDDPKKPLCPVHGYAISAKRYVLFTYERGEIKILDAKGHGLGFLRPPISIRYMSGRDNKLGLPPQQLFGFRNTGDLSVS